MNISDAFESYGPSLVVVNSQDNYCFSSKVPMPLGRSMMQKGLMSCGMHALVPERVAVCTLPTR